MTASATEGSKSGEWGRKVRLHELSRGPIELRLEPDEAQRAAIARELGLLSLPALRAQVSVRPWLDGAELKGRVKAVVEQACSITLEPLEQPVEGPIEVRLVPAGSPNAPGEAGHEVELDLDAPDPPDVIDGDEIDVAAYVVEHLALEIDPFPRKPGAEFDFAPPAEEESPFAVLKALKPKTP